MPEEALQIAVKRREVKGKEKRKDIPNLSAKDLMLLNCGIGEES